MTETERFTVFFAKVVYWATYIFKLPAKNIAGVIGLGNLPPVVTGLDARLTALEARVTALETGEIGEGTGGSTTDTDPYILRDGDTVDPSTPINIETR